MRHFLIATIAALAAGSAAYAQDPAPKADPNAALPPTTRMDQATPTLKAPEGQPQTAPTGRVGEAVPAHEVCRSAKCRHRVRKPPLSSLMNKWVGRYVSSSDGKDLGKIASVRKSGASSKIYFDMGGFLGLGSTPKERNVRSDPRCEERPWSC